MMVHGKAIQDQDKAENYLPTKTCTKVHSRRTSFTEKESLNGTTEKFMMEIGCMGNVKVSESGKIPVEMSIEECGKLINLMGKDSLL